MEQKNYVGDIKTKILQCKTDLENLNIAVKKELETKKDGSSVIIKTRAEFKEVLFFYFCCIMV